jgi:hypothetical protein
MRFHYFLLALTAACGGTTDTTDAGDAASDTTKPDVKPDVAGDVIQDAPPDVVKQPPLAGMTFAVHEVFLGEADRQGDPPSITAWKAYGRDIDGLTTTTLSTDVCTLTAGSPKQNQVDGNNGFDNAWGSVILPIIESAASLSTPSKQVTQAVQLGTTTLLINVVGLTNDPTQTATGLTAQTFGGGNYGSTPAFDSTTDWPILASTVADGKTLASGATAVFPGSTVTNGTFTTSTSTTVITFTLALQGLPLPITIHDPVLSFDHTSATDAMNGTISGVIDPTEFLKTLQELAGNISQSLCGPAFDGIAQQIKQAEDILLDGTNAPNVPCTGISVGLGFNAKLIAPPDTVVQDPQTQNPCGP